MSNCQTGQTSRQYVKKKLVKDYTTEETLYSMDVTKLARKIVDEKDKKEHAERLRCANEGLEKQQRRLDDNGIIKPHGP